jgi:hypothetical protein
VACACSYEAAVSARRALMSAFCLEARGILVFPTKHPAFRKLFGNASWYACALLLTVVVVPRLDSRQRLDDTLQFDTPAGVGTLIPVAVFVQGDFSNTLVFNYSAPLIQRLVVEQPPGSSVVTTLRLVGLNFGGIPP